MNIILLGLFIILTREKKARFRRDKTRLNAQRVLNELNGKR